MSDFILNIASVMSTEIKGLATVAHNTANANTPGYKSQSTQLSNTNFLESITGRGVLPENSVHTNMKAGSLQVTNRPLDFASTGDGWFVLRDADQMYLTKNGRFTIASDGLLTNSAGYAVQGTSGDIFLSGDEVLIADGAIIEENRDISHFLLSASPKKGADLSPMGNGVYKVSQYYRLEGHQNLLQGALEQSNYKAADDIVKMMETTRHIESLQRAIITYNDMLDIGINQLGK